MLYKFGAFEKKLCKATGSSLEHQWRNHLHCHARQLCLHHKLLSFVLLSLFSLAPNTGKNDGYKKKHTHFVFGVNFLKFSFDTLRIFQHVNKKWLFPFKCTEFFFCLYLITFWCREFWKDLLRSTMEHYFSGGSRIVSSAYNQSGSLCLLSSGISSIFFLTPFYWGHCVVLWKTGITLLFKKFVFDMFVTKHLAQLGECSKKKDFDSQEHWMLRHFLLFCWKFEGFQKITGSSFFDH